MKYVIINLDKPDHMLTEISMNNTGWEVAMAPDQEAAIEFDTAEEAVSVIDFIIEVISQKHGEAMDIKAI